MLYVSLAHALKKSLRSVKYFELRSIKGAIEPIVPLFLVSASLRLSLLCV